MATGRIPTTANSPLTAKGDLFSFSTAPARLAVGSNGETLVADSSTSTGLRYTAGTVQANPVLNSAFQVFQRGTSFASVASAAYTADRWSYFNGGASNYTISRQTTSDTTNLPNIQHCVRIQRASGNTQTASQFFANIFETINTIPFVGKTITLSYFARVGANYSGGSTFTGFVGTGATVDVSLFSGVATNNAATSTPSLTTTWQRFTASGNIATSQTQACVYFTWSPSGTAGANDFVEITGVQIDIGSVALPFRTYAETIQGELAACQRYYFRSTPNAFQMYAGGGVPASTSIVDTSFPLPVQMRVYPTSIDNAQIAVNDGLTIFTGGTTIIIGGGNVSRPVVRYTHTSGTLVVYRPYFLGDNGNAGFIGFNAEL